MPTRIILVRHGQSTFNAAKRFQGCSDDSVLTETGQLTAYQTGMALSSIPFDAVYISPLKRTQETAQKILLALQDPSLPVYSHDNLKEVHLPQWQGLSYQEVQSCFADAYRQWQDAPHQFQMELPQPEIWADHGQATIATPAPAPITFSPLHELYTQAQQFWQEIIPKHPDQTLLVISHGGTIRALISTAIGLPMSCYHLLQQSNSGISELTFTPSQQTAQLQALNLTNHLGEVLPKLKNGKQGIRLILLPTNHTTNEISTLLITRLQSIPLNICITDSSDCIQSITTAVLTQHPQPIIQLQVDQPDFLQDWHRTIHSKVQSQTGLGTILAIIHLSKINAFLHHILKLSERYQTLHLKPGTFSVLYYPASTHHLVLQAMNLGAGLGA